MLRVISTCSLLPSRTQRQSHLGEIQIAPGSKNKKVQLAQAKSVTTAHTSTFTQDALDESNAARLQSITTIHRGCGRPLPGPYTWPHRPRLETGSASRSPPHPPPSFDGAPACMHAIGAHAAGRGEQYLDGRQPVHARLCTPHAPHSRSSERRPHTPHTTSRARKRRQRRGALTALCRRWPLT